MSNDSMMFIRPTLPAEDRLSDFAVEMWGVGKAAASRIV